MIIFYCFQSIHSTVSSSQKNPESHNDGVWQGSPVPGMGHHGSEQIGVISPRFLRDLFHDGKPEWSQA